MGNNSYAKYITITGFVELDKYRYVYFSIVFTVYVLIISSNSIIIYLILIHKNLHEPMYVFIAALSFNSVVFSTTVYPKLLIDFLSVQPVISVSACIFQNFIYYSSGGSDFLLLLAMAFDRYVSICKPLQYPTIMRKTTVCLFLLGAWLVPDAQVAAGNFLLISQNPCIFTMTGIFCNNSYLILFCDSSNMLALYGVFILLNVVLLPVIFILFTYAKILTITYNSGREHRKKAAETCLPHLLVLFSFSFLCIYYVVIGIFQSVFSKTLLLIMNLQVVLYNPLLNPVIYGLKMTEISKHLKILFFHEKVFILREYTVYE
uniref:Olfactory receptor n=1 Tax=Sphaeramia orbicularis TaxID=375764 RepID=A0A672YCI7_9TELE